MLTEEKARNALAALNAVIVLARSLAQEGRSSEVADVLDAAEYLPLLMLDEEDRTELFREQLVSLAAKYPDFVLAVERFDK